MSFMLKDALDAILLKKEYKVPSDYSQFAINQYLSKYKSNLPVISKLVLWKLPNQAHYEYLVKNIGYGYQRKVDLTITEDPLIIATMTVYKCSRQDALDSIIFMNEQDKKDILEFYQEIINE